jgi:adenine-specific DNA-methyltransferase
MQVERAKERGAYYTQGSVADFLVWWAVRAPGDIVLDPSSGGGVFLRAAAERLNDLGGQPAAQVKGVEIDADEHGRVQAMLAEAFNVAAGGLAQADFFAVEPSTFGPVDAVVGNPPFIRYQRFTGAVRERALARAREEGVMLSRLVSSWAPFVVHAMAFLRTGGRLAMVLPGELAHAAYARPVLDHVRRRFSAVTVLTFRKRLFADLSEDTVLLLADGYGGSAGHFHLCDLEGVDDLERLTLTGQNGFAGGRDADAAAVGTGRARLIEYLLDAPTRTLYHALRDGPAVRPLGELAEVGIGYVTGANAFFHLSPAEAHRLGIPDDVLAPAVLRGRSLTALRFRQADWEAGAAHGDAALLLRLAANETPTAPVRCYLDAGKSRGVHLAYKCRVRTPWYAVPGVVRPDAFLSYMSGSASLLVANDAGAVAPNSLHTVRLRPGAPLMAPTLAVLWQTSLARLSTEIEGHALGGGMLKLEPGEARRTLIPAYFDDEALHPLVEEVDGLLRRKQPERARDRADAVVLGEHLGLTDAEIHRLRHAADVLRHRRVSR